jgi:hypothetical protein
MMMKYFVPFKNTIIYFNMRGMILQTKNIRKRSKETMFLILLLSVDANKNYLLKYFGELVKTYFPCICHLK